MKLNIFSFSKWISAWTAVATMVVAPVALGEESERISMQTMRTVMTEIGLNKSATIGEFYEHNKSLIPLRLQKEIDPVISKFKNQRMPDIELVSTKGSDGLEVPTLRASQNGELINLQWFGEENRFLKFQNTQLTRVDIVNFNDMIVRIMAGDEKFRKEARPLKRTESVVAPKRNFNFAKYPDMTPRDWKTMSDFDKASYAVNMRLLWLDARKVLAEKKKLSSPAKKTSQNIIEKNEKYFEFLFGQDAEAQSKAKAKVVTESRSAGYFTGESCIVAGYVARYDKQGREFCNHEKIDEIYHTKDNSLYVRAKEYCQSQNSAQIACNPSVFGTPGGKPTCITPSRDKSFQEATLYNGPCDSASRLQASQTNVSILKKDTDVARYDDANLLSRKEREAIFQSDQGKENFKATEEYLLGVLKFRKSVKDDTKSLFDQGVLDDTVLAQILIDKKGFDNEIAEANNSCKLESDASKTKKRIHEPNYWKACDQLNRRFLFIEALFASKCDVGSNLDQSTLKCACAIPAGQKIVPGAKCSSAKPPILASMDPSKPETIKPEPKRNCVSEFPGAFNLSPDCKCPSGGYPNESASFEGKKSYECKEKPEGGGKDDNACGFFCTHGQKLLLWGGLAVVGLVAYFAIFKVKKPKIANPGDGCPIAGMAPPCTPICKAPLSMQNGTCACAPCAPGQAVAAGDLACNCTSSPLTTTTTTMFVCPDGVTSKADISQCPYYTCNTTTPPTTYQNPSNCPTTQSNPTPSTGGATR